MAKYGGRLKKILLKMLVKCLNSMQFGAFSAGDLSEEEVSDLPSCAFAGRPTSNSGLQHHYLSNLHHNG